ncbi:MAG: glutamate-1-semialdehyde 2,1-aminomutase [Phycisphaerae bacterium]|nr:glutamate-1-semialdehyde 2,1-aminomutase [Phycisphaerae bacterium]
MNPSNKSLTAFERAKAVIPGGVNSPVRAFGGVDRGPLFIASAAGATLTDVDGNRYIDYVGSWGPMILGHTHPEVVEAVQAAAAKGTSYGAPTEGETELAERLVAAVTSIDKVRLVSSGTEAVMTALRLARAYTKRDTVVKMIGCYHGHSDGMLVNAGSGLAEHGVPSSAGVAAGTAEQTIALPYNNLDAVRQAFAKFPDQIAAVIVEPIAANMGVVPPKEGYLEGLRQLCDTFGAVLIFDEVITGFRVAYGGAQERYGLNADLTCLGKIIGGGLPAAAVGGRRDIMDMLSPLGPVYQAGTLSGNPLAVAAANKTLDLLDRPGVYAALDQKGDALEVGLKTAAEKTGTPLTVNRVGSILCGFFTDRPVNNFDDVQTTNIARFKRFFAQMLDQGVYLAPSAYEAMFVSLAHTEENIEKTVAAAYNALKIVARASCP